MAPVKRSSTVPETLREMLSYRNPAQHCDNASIDKCALLDPGHSQAGPVFCRPLKGDHDHIAHRDRPHVVGEWLFEMHNDILLRRIANNFERY